MKNLVGEFPFEIDARVPIQLGRESISNSIVAVSELIKNSYDADAKSIRIAFVNDPTDGPSIVIEDDGNGMGFEDLTDNWLKIGTTNKTLRGRSKGGRVLTGAKGLGRLGIDRLCERLTLQTKLDDSDRILELDVEWSRYLASDANFSDIKHSVAEYHVSHTGYHGGFFSEGGGTRLLLRSSKDRWDEGRLQQLRKEIALLISPFYSKNDFSVYLDSDYPELNGQISSEEYLDAAPWKIESVIDLNGAITSTFTYNETGEVFTEGPVSWPEFVKGFGNFPECGPVSFRCFYIPNTAYKNDRVSFGAKDLKTFMESNQGIRIYRDEFRVRPYGEPSGKGDWLDLGMRRSRSPGGIRQGGWRVGPHQVLGGLFIGRDANSSLADQTNREGLVENGAFEHLRIFAIKIIEAFEVKANEIANRDMPTEDRNIADRKSDAIKAADASKDAVSRFRDSVSELKDNDKNLDLSIETHFKEIEDSLSDAIAKNEMLEVALLEKTAKLEHEKDTLANLASLGILSISFGHESKEFSNLAASNASNLKMQYKMGRLQLTEPYGEDFLKSIDRIIKSTDFINRFSSFALNSIRPDKRKRKKVHVDRVISKVFSALDTSLERQNINVEVETGEGDHRIYAYEIDLESILVNMITNSVWAMKKTPAEDRLIRVIVYSTETKLTLRFIDSGFGLEAGTETVIFNPMYTTKRSSKGIAEGTGMGLTITKTFVEEHLSGTIQAKNNEELGGAEFVMEFPK